MTTLKEIMEQHNVPAFLKDDCFSKDAQDQIYKAIKEWLTEKRQKAFLNCPPTNYHMSRVSLVDELLKEIEGNY